MAGSLVRGRLRGVVFPQRLRQLRLLGNLPGDDSRHEGYQFGIRRGARAGDQN